MTDAELTKLAGVAFGNPPVGFSPLTDDGDALRLAVKLGILVDVTAFSVTAIVNGAISAKEKHNGDPYSSTRRAITRAAAAIGEVKK